MIKNIDTLFVFAVFNVVPLEFQLRNNRQLS